MKTLAFQAKPVASAGAKVLDLGTLEIEDDIPGVLPARQSRSIKLRDNFVRTAFKRAGREVPERVEIYYSLLDGAFRYLMQGQIWTHGRTRAELKATFRALLEQFL